MAAVGYLLFGDRFELGQIGHDLLVRLHIVHQPAVTRAAFQPHVDGFGDLRRSRA